MKITAIRTTLVDLPLHRPLVARARSVQHDATSAGRPRNRPGSDRPDLPGHIQPLLGMGGRGVADRTRGVDSRPGPARHDLALPPDAGRHDYGRSGAAWRSSRSRRSTAPPGTLPLKRLGCHSGAARRLASPIGNLRERGSLADRRPWTPGRGGSPSWSSWDFKPSRCGSDAHGPRTTWALLGRSAGDRPGDRPAGRRQPGSGRQCCDPARPPARIRGRRPDLVRGADPSRRHPWSDSRRGRTEHAAGDRRERLPTVRLPRAYRSAGSRRAHAGSPANWRRDRAADAPPRWPTPGGYRSPRTFSPNRAVTCWRPVQPRTISSTCPGPNRCWARSSRWSAAE